MSTYYGNRQGGRATVMVGTRPLPPRYDLRNHSPDGFEWGYSGSGPSQLALALAAHVTGDDTRALRVYLKLRDRLVARIHKDVWQINDGYLLEVIRAIEIIEGPIP